MPSRAAKPRPTHPDGAPDHPSPAVVRALLDNHDRFLGFLERRLGRRDLAEEILHDAFVRGADRGTDLRDGESAVAWIYRLLRNAMVDRHRKAAAERRALQAMAAEPLPPHPRPDDSVMQEICGCLMGLLDTLKPEYAEALRKVDLGNEEVATWAAEAGITVNNAGVRLHRAREALRRQLVRSCGACSLHACLDCAC